METQKDSLPVIVKIGKTAVMDLNIFDYSDKYNDETELLEEGTYFMGSKTVNTRCNKFTIIGADKTHADDTKDK